MMYIQVKIAQLLAKQMSFKKRAAQCSLVVRDIVHVAKRHLHCLFVGFLV